MSQLERVLNRLAGEARRTVNQNAGDSLLIEDPLWRDDQRLGEAFAVLRSARDRCAE
jgi:hypothetical protein